MSDTPPPRDPRVRSRPIPPPPAAGEAPPPLPSSAPPFPEDPVAGPPPIPLAGTAGASVAGAPVPESPVGGFPTAATAADAELTFDEQQGVGVRPCPNCGGNFHFGIPTQQLVCPHCGTTEAIVHGADDSVDEQPLDPHSYEVLSNRALTHAVDEKEVVCSNCGGHTTFIGSTTATKCPYCATPLQRSDIHEAPDRLAVDGVLPFSIDARRADAIMKDWIQKRWFAPNEFKQYSTAGSFASVYAAYFTYDAVARTAYVGQRGTRHTRTVGSGDNRRTVTETRWRRVSGNVVDEFDDMTILANTGFDPRFVDQLEPWPTHDLRPYSPDYVAGHLCRTYDNDVTTCFDTAKTRMATQIDHTIRRDIGGDEQRIERRNTRLSGVSYKHVLLPIWLLTVIYAGQRWQVFVNGATGEIHGQRPWSKVKIGFAIALVVLVILAIVIARAVTG